MDPINYAIDVESPFTAVAKGYQLGTGIRDDYQQQAALQQAQQQKVQQQTALMGLINNPSAGAKDYAAATLLMPQLKDQFKQAWDMKNTAQQESLLKDAGQYYSAVTSGRPDLAIQMMQKRADAMQASGGNPQEIQGLRTQAQIIEAHPEFARTHLGLMLASLPGGDKVLTGASTMGTEQRAQDQAPAKLLQANAEAGIKAVEAGVAPQKVATDLANVQSQINERSQRFGLDKDKFQSELQLKIAEFKQKAGDLPEPVMKGINEATTNAVSAQQSSGRMNQLADQIDSASAQLGSGVTAKTGELWKKTFGSQDELTRIRNEYSRIVTPAAMSAYKQVASGSTSDKDIETAMVGVPSDTASPERMASFLRGAAKLQIYESVMENAKAEWLTNNKFLGKTKSDIEIDGVKVPAGTTFKQFADGYVGKKAGEMAGASLVNSLAKKYGPQTGGATGGY